MHKNYSFFQYISFLFFPFLFLLSWLPSSCILKQVVKISQVIEHPRIEQAMWLIRKSLIFIFLKNVTFLVFPLGHQKNDNRCWVTLSLFGGLSSSFDSGI